MTNAVDSIEDVIAYVRQAPLFTTRLFVTDTFEVYLRIRYRSIEGTSVLCCDVGRVHCCFKKQGIYSNLLKQLEENAAVEILFIENVHNPFHYSIYLNRGFTQYVPSNEYGEVSHFYKRLPKG